MAEGLTPKQRRFVAEYLVHLNATRAYAAAYGAIQSTAETAGPRLLGNVRVSAEIERQIELQSARVLVTADQVLLDIQRIARKAEAAREWQAALRALELIGRRYKLFTDRVEVVDNTPRAERLRDARARRLKVAADVGPVGSTGGRA